MNPTAGRFLAACLWFMGSPTIAQDAGGQSAPELLNQIDQSQSATCQIAFNDSYTCSGALINNTQNPGRPLVLTAAHCIESEEDLDSIVVIFGRRKLLQDQPYAGWNWSSRAGAVLLSSSAELDFALLEMKGEIPLAVAPVYLGWNKALSQPARIASIHSPDFGDAQYVFSLAPPAIATYGGLYHAVASGHWRVDQWAAGSTALGSSGAPLLDARFEIIGGLSGSTDWENYTSDYFFRFDLAYDHFSDPARQLQAWIDPANAGASAAYRPARKIRNYTFTSPITETVRLTSGESVAEQFSVRGEAKINGVYVVAGELSGRPDSTVTVTLSQDGSELSAAVSSLSALSDHAENYIPLLAPALLSGNLTVSLTFESTDSTAYITIPKRGAGNSASHFLAVNLSEP